MDGISGFNKSSDIISIFAKSPGSKEPKPEISTAYTSAKTSHETRSPKPAPPAIKAPAEKRAGIVTASKSYNNNIFTSKPPVKNDFTVVSSDDASPNPSGTENIFEVADTSNELSVFTGEVLELQPEAEDSETPSEESGGTGSAVAGGFAIANYRFSTMAAFVMQSPEKIYLLYDLWDNPKAKYIDITI